MAKKQILVLLIIILIFSLLIIAPKLPGQLPSIKASITLEEFRSLPDKQQLAALKTLAKSSSIEEARSFLKNAYPSEPSDKHELVHAIGEAAYLKYGYDGLSKCDSLFMFGCYHGVVLEAIRQNGYNDKVLADLATGCLNISKNKTVTTACSHGIGHAIMVVKSYDLISSYHDCDKTFTSKEELFYCWDGVSMENIMRRFEGTDAQRFLKDDDPYYPCNSVDLKYQPACAREHVYYIIDLIAKRDFPGAKDYCLSFKSEETRVECTSAIGNFLTQDYYDNPQKIVEECQKLGNYSNNCLVKVATQYSFSHQPEKANLICQQLPQDQQGKCGGSVEYAQNAL